MRPLPIPTPTIILSDLGDSTMKCWLLLVDLDGTLWDNLDISALKPPFRRISEKTVIDSSGVEVNLYLDMVYLIKWAKENGAFISVLSWNIPDIAIEALNKFNLTHLFNYLVIGPHPDKGIMALKALKHAEKSECVPCAIIYIDDRDIHLEGVKKRIDNKLYLKTWMDFKNVNEAKNIISAHISRVC